MGKVKAFLGRFHLPRPHQQGATPLASLILGILLIIVVLGVLVVLLKVWGISINTTPSLPIGLYKTESQEGGMAIKRGDTVQFHLTGAQLQFAQGRGYVKDELLLKRVWALAGDTVERTVQGIVINGLLYENSAHRLADSRGRSMPMGVLPAVVPEGYVLVLGDTLISFDSRYFGLVPVETLKKTTPFLLF